MDASLDCLGASTDVVGGSSSVHGAVGLETATGSLEIIPENCPLDPQVRRRPGRCDRVRAGQDRRNRATPNMTTTEGWGSHLGQIVVISHCLAVRSRKDLATRRGLNVT